MSLFKPTGRWDGLWQKNCLQVSVGAQMLGDKFLGWKTNTNETSKHTCFIEFYLQIVSTEKISTETLTTWSIYNLPTT